MPMIIQGFPQPLEMSVVHGGAAATGLRKMAGVQPGDTLVNVRHISADLVTNADVTSDASVSAPDEITLALTDTTGDFVLAVWQREPA